MSNYNLVIIDQRFIAETIAMTGTNQIMKKAFRSYIGLYDKEENWYIPLRSKLKVHKIPQSFYFETPFPHNETYFKNPGLDFQKALFVPNDYIIPIKNTMHPDQAMCIERNARIIRSKFEDFVVKTANHEMSVKQLEQNTVALFPEGVEKILKQILEEKIMAFLFEGFDVRRHLLNEDSPSGSLVSTVDDHPDISLIGFADKDLFGYITSNGSNVPSQDDLNRAFERFGAGKTIDKIKLLDEWTAEGIEIKNRIYAKGDIQLEKPEK